MVVSDREAREAHAGAGAAALGRSSTGIVVLPKSTREARIAENAALFDFTLDADAMARLDGLDEGLATGWDPAQQA